MNSISHLPKCRILIDGEALRPSDAMALESISIIQRASLPASCEMVFNEPGDMLLRDLERYSGNLLEVGMGDCRQALFTGVVTSVNFSFGTAQQRTVRIRACDKLYTLRKVQHIRSHVQVTLRDLFGEAAAESGISVDAPRSGSLWNWVIQYQQSDLDFLAAMAQRAGSYFFLDGDVLRLFSLEGLETVVVLERGTSLFEAEVEVNGARSIDAVSACGWNPSLVTSHIGRAETPRIHRTASADLHDGTGVTMREYVLPGKNLENDAFADTMAQKILDHHAAGEVVVSGVADGNPELQPGVRVAVNRLGASLDGEYVAMEVVHTIDMKRGYLSRFSTRPPEFKIPMEHFPAMLGIVNAVDDPQGYGRIKASLPAFGDIETDWMSVALPAAGNGKGLIALPDVGDRVLIALTCGEPASGIIIGGLCGSQAQPPDWGVDGGAVKRYQLATPGGQRVVLDDGKNSVRIENESGSFYDLSPDRCTVHSAADLHIEAPGKTVVIKGDKIDFVKG